MPDITVKTILEAVNNTKTAFSEVKADVEEMSKGFSGMENMLQGAVGALSAYAGTKGLMGMVRASENANKMLVQSRFFLKGMGGDVEKNLSILKRWGSETQKTIGINDEFAVLVASRLAPRIKDLNKIQNYATTLLKGHRIGVLDAESASIMLMRVVEGNSRALKWLAYNLGITVHEFESMDSIMAKIERRVENLAEQLSPFNQAWAKLRENFSDFMEETGAPFVIVLGTILDAILKLIEKFPILGEVIKAAFVVINGALAGLGFGLALQTILKFFGITTALAAPWAAIIVGAIFGVIYAVGALKKYWEEYKDTILIVGAAVTAVLVAIGGAMGSWAVVIVGILAAIIFNVIAFKEKWQKEWQIVADFFTQLWKNIEKNFGATVGQIGKAADWLYNKIKPIMDAINALEAKALKVFEMIGKTVVESVGIKGTKQFGGYIPETGPYFLHKGEYVVPPGKTGAISLTITGNTFLDEDSAVKMGDLIVKVLQRHIKI